jgi:hypothetical protein
MELSFHVAPIRALVDWEIFALKNGAISFLEWRGRISSKNSAVNERPWRYAERVSSVPPVILDHPLGFE